MTHKVKYTRTWLSSQLVMVFEGQIDYHTRLFGHSKCHGRKWCGDDQDPLEDFTVHYTDSHPDSQNKYTRNLHLEKSRCKLCDYGYCRNKRIMGDSP